MRLPAIMIGGIDEVIDDYLMPLILNDRHSTFVRLPNDQIRLAPRLLRYQTSRHDLIDDMFQYAEEKEQLLPP